MAEFKKKQVTDKIELKKKHAMHDATQIVDFQIILLKLKILPALITTPVFPVAFPIFVFTFTTERKKIFPKLFTYHGIKK